MLNDAELCELGWEVVVVVLGFFADLDGSKGVLGDLWGYYGDRCPIKSQMDVCYKHRCVDLASLYAFNAQKILISLDYQLG